MAVGEPRQLVSCAPAGQRSGKHGKRGTEPGVRPRRLRLAMASAGVDPAKYTKLLKVRGFEKMLPCAVASAFPNRAHVAGPGGTVAARATAACSRARFSRCAPGSRAGRAFREVCGGTYPKLSALCLRACGAAILSRPIRR